MQVNLKGLGSLQLKSHWYDDIQLFVVYGTLIKISTFSLPSRRPSRARKWAT